MRVLQVTTTSSRRGAEMFAHQLGRALTSRGHDVRTVAMEPASSTVALPFEHLEFRRRDPRAAMELARRSRNSDVLVAHGGATLGFTSLVSAIARRPFVYRNIGDPAHWGRARGAKLRIGVPLRRAAHVVALYDAAARYMCDRYRLPPSRVSVAGNAVEEIEFPRCTEDTRSIARQAFGCSSDQVILGFLGNLSSEKRPDWAISTARGIQGSRLLMAGVGPMRSVLEHRAQAVDARTRPETIKLVGPVPNPAVFLSALDVLLIPSATEGIPGVLLEAALVGVPVVATAVGGVPEVMDELGAGVTVPPDDLGGFIDATQSVVANARSFRVPREVVSAHHGMTATTNKWESVLGHVVHPS
ncbi:MAG: glycosyltransferase family 4 protein [Propioniciclava sp.]